jgi:hypothetical protein
MSQRVITIGSLGRVATYGGDGPTSQLVDLDIGGGCLGVPMHGRNGVVSCDVRRMRGLGQATYSPHTASTVTSAGMPAGSKPSTVSGLHRAHLHERAKKARRAARSVQVAIQASSPTSSVPGSDAESDPSAPANADAGSSTTPPDDPTADTSSSTLLFGESLPTLLVWGAIAAALGYGIVMLASPKAPPRPRVSDTAPRHRRRARRSSRRR